MTFKPLILVPFLATPAFAGSLDQAAPEPAPAAPVVPVTTPATGDWTGPSVGVQLGYGSADADGPADDSEEGALYGVRAFYDHDFGNWVAGGGLQYDGADIDLGDAGNVDGIAKLGGRVGYDMGRTMIYGSGGYAHASTDGGALDAGSSDGYYVGIGAETYVTDNVTVSGELNYNEFEDFDANDLKVGATTATVGLNYRF
ncbi:outer membrane protein [Salipiger abyssi]|uniref:Outer membrane insertion C-terminal signal-containing protein n=1 Tax=Salipiger abyssi TaxID=1250539 RepID=A0A1P8V001_9RHOB|nr:outer membrane beta-barrel protein [Salipiger abyssi]APZ54984.1 outer membrane insertion C-terminal signal-containing protein [Salipiger abyssi]